MRIDWAFSEEGDLVLSDPLVDDQGNVLYIHTDGTIDTEQGEDGKPIRDIGYSYGLEAEKQVIYNRLKTDAPDWYLHPLMGGNLSDLIGEPNRRETGEKGARLIMEALTYEGLYHPSQIDVRPVPVSPSEILFLITITGADGEFFHFPVVFDLNHGVLNFYEVKTE